MTDYAILRLLGGFVLAFATYVAFVTGQGLVLFMTLGVAILGLGALAAAQDDDRC